MRATIYPVMRTETGWQVEFLDEATGDISTAFFTGPKAEEQARSFAEREYGGSVGVNDLAPLTFKDAVVPISSISPK